MIKLKPLATAIVIASLLIIAACNTSKKTSTSKANTPTPVATTTTTATPGATTAPASYGVFSATKSADGVYKPGNDELLAIQFKYPGVTMDQLKQGHQLYTVGACTRCHGALNIYVHDETQWKDIIDRMAIKANISEEEKQAVHKYVLSIKATQPR